MQDPIVEIVNYLYHGVVAGQNVDMPEQLDEAKLNALDKSYSSLIFELGEHLSSENGEDEEHLERLIQNKDLLNKYNVVFPKILSHLSEIPKGDIAFDQAQQCRDGMLALDLAIALNDLKIPEQQQAAGRAMSMIVDNFYHQVQSDHLDVGGQAERLGRLIQDYQDEFLDEKKISMLIQFQAVFREIAVAYKKKFSGKPDYDRNISEAIIGINYPASNIVGDYEEQQKSARGKKETTTMVQAAKELYAKDVELSEDFDEEIKSITSSYAKAAERAETNKNKSVEPTIIAIMKEVGRHEDVDPYETLIKLMKDMENRNIDTLMHVELQPEGNDFRVHPISLNEIAEFTNSHDDVSLLDAVYLQARADNVTYVERTQSTTQERMEAKLIELKQRFPETPINKIIQDSLEDAARAFPEKFRQRKKEEREEKMEGHGFRPEWTHHKSEPKPTHQQEDMEFKDACRKLGIKPDAFQSMDKKDIEKAYRKAALRAHPDQGGSKEAFQALTNARELLDNRKESDQAQTPARASFK